MEAKLLFVSDGKDCNEIPIEVNDTVLINFSRDFKANEYCFTFENKNYSSLAFTFITNLAIDCYFVFVPKTGKPRFTGYHTLQNEEIVVDINDCSKFYILIPRNKNQDVCTALTLVSLFTK